jgi:hypothetical protein
MRKELTSGGATTVPNVQNAPTTTRQNSAAHSACGSLGRRLIAVCSKKDRPGLNSEHWAKMTAA